MKMFWKRSRSRINGFPLTIIGDRGADGRLRTSPTLHGGRKSVPHMVSGKPMCLLTCLCISFVCLNNLSVSCLTYTA